MRFTFLCNKKYRKIAVDILLGLGKSIFLNFKYLPMQQAFRLPILVSHHCELLECNGKIKIDSAQITPGMIAIGLGNVALFPSKSYKSCLELGEKSKLVFKGKCRLGSGVRISSNGTITFGKNFILTANSYFFCRKSISFGDDCLVSWNVSVQDTDGHSLYQGGEKINDDTSISIGNHVWICANCSLLKGSRVPSNVVIGFGSIVSKTRDIPFNCVINRNNQIHNDIDWVR